MPTVQLIPPLASKSGFAVPQFYAYLEAEKIPYTIAQISNIRLHLAASHPGEPLWHLLASRPDRR